MSKSFLNTFKTQNLKTSFFSYLSLVFFVFIPHNETVDDKYCIYEIASKPNCSPNPNYSYSTEPEVLKSFSELVVPVAFWGINQDDGSHDNPLTKEKIKESIDLLNHAFKAIKSVLYLKISILLMTQKSTGRIIMNLINILDLKDYLKTKHLIFMSPTDLLTMTITSEAENGL